jgi:ABC-type sugar transport system permease subunit
MICILRSFRLTNLARYALILPCCMFSIACCFIAKYLLLNSFMTLFFYLENTFLQNCMHDFSTTVPNQHDHAVAPINKGIKVKQND